MQYSIKILLADNHVLMRLGLRTILEVEKKFTIIGEASNDTEVKPLCQELTPDILLLSLNIFGASTHTIVQSIHQAYPTIKLLIFSTYEDIIYVRTLLDLGIKGYLFRSDPPETILRAIDTVFYGRHWYSETLTNSYLGWEQTARHLQLTDRELTVLHLLTIAETNKEIGYRLNITERTVRFHLENIYRKLAVTTKIKAVIRAIQLGLIDVTVWNDR